MDTHTATTMLVWTKYDGSTESLPPLYENVIISLKDSNFIEEGYYRVGEISMGDSSKGLTIYGNPEWGEEYSIDRLDWWANIPVHPGSMEIV